MTQDGVQITVTRTLTKDQQARRIRLVEAARELAREGGYPSVTMHDVADRADVARATVYRYFASKDHLLTEVAADWSREIMGGLELTPWPDNPEEQLAELMERIVTVAAQDLTLTSTIVQAVTSPDPSIEQARLELFLFIRARVSAAMGVPESNEPRTGPQGDFEIVLGHLLLSALVSLTALRTPVEEVATMVRTATHLLIAGMRSKG